tara:strand:- start:76 stop:267 length:192 start_codon:yes stop_codon:yes gene_type:complete
MTKILLTRIKKRIKSYFSLEEKGYAFRDAVSNKNVYYYKDCYGAWYMKTHRWSLFSARAFRGN